MNAGRQFVLLMLAFLTGCQAAMYGTAQDLNAIDVGMTKSEVIQKLGNPSSTAASPKGEYLIYRKMEAVVSDWPKDYFVKIENGHVVSFGRKGDFDSTKNATMDVNIKSEVKTADTTPPPASSRLDQVGQLFKLRQSGALTQEEYDAQKQKLLEQ